jgi:hypothetical protein
MSNFRRGLLEWQKKEEHKPNGVDLAYCTVGNDRSDSGINYMPKNVSLTVSIEGR